MNLPEVQRSSVRHHMHFRKKVGALGKNKPFRIWNSTETYLEDFKFLSNEDRN